MPSIGAVPRPSAPPSSAPGTWRAVPAPDHVSTMPNTDLVLRAATVADTPIILELVTALAEYERIADGLVATEERLRESLFGPSPEAEVVLAEVDGRSAGFAIFFHNYSTLLARKGIWLEDLFVRPEHRGRGIGRRLLEHLARLAVERGCGRLEWWVLDWNESAIRFYRSLGALPMDQWTVYRITGDALETLARNGG